MVAAGLALADRLLAVVCASHDGRPEHLAAVREILAGAGLGEDDLANTPALPLDLDAARDVVRGGGGPAVDHPELQRQARRDAGDGGDQRLADRRLPRPPTTRCSGCIVDDARRRRRARCAHVGVDGCGAPAPVTSLVGLARAVRALAVERPRRAPGDDEPPGDGRRADAATSPG